MPALSNRARIVLKLLAHDAEKEHGDPWKSDSDVNAMLAAQGNNTSEMIATICDGSTVVKGNRKPLALVRIVNTRNQAVQPGSLFEANNPPATTNPSAIAIMLMMRWKTVKPANDMPNIMMRPLFRTPPRLHHTRRCATEVPFLYGATSQICGT